MALQQGALRDALIEAGASHKDSINQLRLDLADVKGDVKLLKWVLGAVGAGVLSLIVGMDVLLLRTQGLGG